MTIVEEIRADREKGAARLAREYRGRLQAAARRLGADAAEAEALAYRTLDEAVRALDGYSERDAFYPWLKRILVNLRAKDTRRRAHETVRFVAEPPEPSAPEVEGNGARQVAAAVDAGLLRDAIDALPGEMREAVVLRYFLDLPLGRMARLLSLPVGTVKSRLYYARVLLGRRLGALRLAALAAALAVAALGAWAAARLIAPTYYWRPGRTLGDYDARENWSVEGPDGASAAARPGADARLAGAGDYAFAITNRAGATLQGWDAPEDWDDHTLVVAEGALRFTGDVTTHTGELTIERGASLTLLEGSSFTPARFSAGKWTTRIKAGGVFNLLGAFAGYGYRIVVEPGGEATLNPRAWGGFGSSEQADNAVENFGTLNLPAGLVWRQGGASAVRYSVWLRQSAGVLNIGGPVARADDARGRMTLGVELLGGRVNVSGDVSFAADVARLGGNLVFALAKGARLDLSTVAVARGAEVAFTGEGEVILPAGDFASLTADDTVTLRTAADDIRPGDLVLRGGEKLSITGSTVLAGRVLTRPGPGGELPGLTIERGATLTVPGGTRLGGLNLTVRGTLATRGAGDLVLGHAATGSTAPFSLVVDGGTVSNACGNIDFLCPDFGGRVGAIGHSSIRAVEPGVCSLQFAVCSSGDGSRVERVEPEESLHVSSRSTRQNCLSAANCKLQTANSLSNAQMLNGSNASVLLRDATLWTDARHGFNFGVNNPEDEALTVRLERTTLTYAQGTYCVAGGVTLDFRDGARLFRADRAREQADLIVSGRARLVFGPGTDLHYGASANGFGSVGNGGLSFLPTEDGYCALVLDRASFWYHHPNSIRGAHRASLAVTNAVYELRAMNWNYRMPFRGFRSVAVEGQLLIRTTRGTGAFAWDGSDDPRDLCLPASVRLTGTGEIRLAPCDGDARPLKFTIPEQNQPKEKDKEAPR